MKPAIPLESQIQAEVDLLRPRFPQTKDLYRETCVLLFFRHGITPTANKLYSLVRKGSMSAPANALDTFWRDLREKSRVRIEAPDIPEGLRESAGNLVSALWRQAQEAAADSFAQRLVEVAEAVSINEQTAEAATRLNADMEQQIASLKTQLETTQQRAAEVERLRAGDISTLAAQEKTFKTLLNERDRLAMSLENARSNFSHDLEKLSASLRKAEDQYRMYEKKASLELEKSRQNAIKLEKANSLLRTAAKAEQDRCRKESTALQRTISELREKVGILTGRFSEISEQHKETLQRLKRTERMLTTAASKASSRVRSTSRKSNKK